MSANLAFDETYRRYLAQLADLDIDRRGGILGAVMKAGTPEVSFLGNTYRVSAGGVSGSDGKRPSHAVSVVLLKYFILCPESIPENRGWVSYRDFRDAAPFAGAFAGNTEQA
ncbi:MAG: DUF3786 domain-containing protein, partial [Desulfosalsimonas sp.]